MGSEINWYSKQGLHTDDNRDFCGVGLRSDATLCIVLDGSSSGANSGKLALLIARDLIDWFMITGQVTLEAIINRLRHIHTDLSTQFRRDSASFVIALLAEENVVQVLHSGDCLAGIHEGKVSIDWRTQPHTLANPVDDMLIADIAASPVRHRLTRSFRSREFIRPDASELAIKGDEQLILATDGFWAALDSEDQVQFLAGQELPHAEDRDDCSVLSLQFSDGQSCKVGGEDVNNLYVVSAAG